MTIAIMQPYFMPYIGYWQLINAVDQFVVYDDIEFTKKGWIHRNRILQNGKDVLFTLPLKKDSDFLPIMKRSLAFSFAEDSVKILRKIEAAYRKAPFYKEVMPLVEECVSYNDRNLFNYIYNSINKICEYLEIQTPIIKSSTLAYNSDLKAQNKVLNICDVCAADIYINAIGGEGLYDRETFRQNGIDLKFHKMNYFEYAQFNDPFVPFLSIVDVIMFNTVEEVRDLLKAFILV